MIDSAKKYHIRTSYDRHKMTPHSLDWANQPSFYKAYPATDPTLLPGDIPFPEGKPDAHQSDDQRQGLVGRQQLYVVEPGGRVTWASELAQPARKDVERGLPARCVQKER